MRKSRFTGAQIIGMIREHEAVYLQDIADDFAAQRVVVALPCKTCSIGLPSIRWVILHHQMPGLGSRLNQLVCFTV